MEFNVFRAFPDDMEAEWNSLLDASVTHVPFLRFEYQQAWWQTRGGNEWPQAELAIVTARDSSGRLIGIAPLFLAQHQDQPALLILGSIEISDYLDLLVRPADLEDFIAALLPFLASENLPTWKTFDLYNLLDSSPTLAVLEKTAAALGWTASIERLQHSPFIALPGDWDTYLAGIDKKQRHEIRRKMRRLESADVPTRWYIVDDPASLTEEVESFICLMALDPEKERFLTPAMREHMHKVVQCAFDSHCLQLSFLEIGGEKAAAYLSFDFLNRLWVYNSGLDRRFNEYSPGWVLLGDLLQWANENHRDEFDFMRGDEEYKYRFGATDRFVMRLTLQKPD